MKKQQVIYIFIAIFLILAFLFMLTNTTTYNPGYSSYDFHNSLANHAGLAEGMSEGKTTKNTMDEDNDMMEESDKEGAVTKTDATPKVSTSKSSKSGFQNREGYAGLQMSPVENQFKTIVPYLDNARGPQCAGSSNGVTATGGPLCLSQDQQNAMASRGMNSVLNTCRPYNSSM